MVIRGNIINEGRIFNGSIRIEGDMIVDIEDRGAPLPSADYILPGVIDEHVHFREPGLTEKGDIESESRAAAAGGVTSFFDMPNTKPQTTTREALDDKLQLAASKSLVNYAFFIGATNDNSAELEGIDATLVPGIKLFMGASTGNMLVDGELALTNIFKIGKRTGLPIVAHCEDSVLIARNESIARNDFGSEAEVRLHSVIRNEEVCLNSTRKAIALAEASGARLMIAHVSTDAELREINAARNVCAEGCVAYLFFCDQDYERLGARIKCNPAIKSAADRQALRQALTDGRLHTIATDHAPHLMEQKQGGVFKAVSGMPSVQFSLPLMLSLVDEGVLNLTQVVQLMCHNPASYFGVQQRGFIREGYKADLTIVRHTDNPHTINEQEALSKCGWTPFVGIQTRWQVQSTICNGTTVYRHNEGIVAPDNHRGQQIVFNHDN